MAKPVAPEMVEPLTWVDENNPNLIKVYRCRWKKDAIIISEIN